MTTLKEKAEALKVSFRGEIYFEGDEEYVKTTNSYWNTMNNNKKPAVVFQPLGAADVSRAIVFSRENKLEVAVKSGGHGKSYTENGALIDLCRMKHVIVNATAKQCSVGTGCLLGDVDRELSYYNLAVPLGTAPITGIGGLSLHGGMGILSRKYGLTMDNILEVEIVTADGKIQIASPSVNEELFWGIRGGASNFGVVTNIVFKLHELPPTVYGGFAVQPPTKIKETLLWAQDMVDRNTDTGMAIHVMPSPQGYIVGSMLAHYGPKDVAEAEIKPLLDLAPVVAAGFSHQPYHKVQDVLMPIFGPIPRMRNVGRGVAFTRITEEVIDVFLEKWAKITAHENIKLITALQDGGGAMSNIKDEESPFSCRDKQLVTLNFVFVYPNAEDDELVRDLANDLVTAFRPWALEKIYINSDNTRVRQAHGAAQYEKLKALKEKYDPEHVFKGTLTWD